MNNTGLILDAVSIDDLKELAVKAENANYHSVWSTELYRTSFQQISSTASVTSRIKLGTAVALAFTRSPLITALTAMDIDELSDGRFILGLGSGAKYTNEKYHGVNYGKPVKRMKELISLIRKYISSSHIPGGFQFKGEYYDINTKGYRRAFKPLRDNIDIYLAGIGANMVRTAGESADGYIGHVVCSYNYLNEVVLPAIDHGLEISGRERKEFNIASIITCAVSEDIDKAVNDAKATIGFYATVRTYREPFLLHGFEKEIEEIRKAYFENDIKKLIRSVSDKMVEVFAIVGNKDYCLEKVNEYRDYVDIPILSAPHYFIDFKHVAEYQDRLIELFTD